VNREWSELNRKMQSGLAKRADFNNGISTLFELRNTLLRALVTLKDELTEKQFSAMPFSRHWIMHTEAALRIRNGINKYK